MGTGVGTGTDMGVGAGVGAAASLPQAAKLSRRQRAAKRQSNFFMVYIISQPAAFHKSTGQFVIICENA